MLVYYRFTLPPHSSNHWSAMNVEGGSVFQQFFYKGWVILDHGKEEPESLVSFARQGVLDE